MIPTLALLTLAMGWGQQGQLIDMGTTGIYIHNPETTAPELPLELHEPISQYFIWGGGSTDSTPIYCTIKDGNMTCMPHLDIDSPAKEQQ